MPTIITRGVASARGAGTFALVPPVPLPPPPPGPPPPPPPPGPGPTVQTVVFNGSGSWTAPLDVVAEQIFDLFIAGGQYGETPGQWINAVGLANPFYSAEGTSQAGSPSAFYTYAQVGAIGDALFAQINAGAPAERTFSYTQILNFYNPNTGGYYDSPQPSGTITTRGFAYIGGGAWDNRSNAPVQGIGNGWFIGGEKYFPPQVNDGTPSSAFGYTVQGGTQANPSPVEYFGTNSIIPGQTYQIIVGSIFGSVSFRFIQG